MKIEQALEELDYSNIKKWLDNNNNVNHVLPHNKLTLLQDILLVVGDDESLITKIVNLLLDYNALVNVPDSKDYLQPLFSAVREGYAEVVERLLKDGANADLEDEERYTPLLTAVEMQDARIVRALAAKSSKATLHKSGGHWAYQPLGLAMSNLDTNIISILLEKGCDPFSYDNDMGQNIERLPTDISTEDRNKINDILSRNGYTVS